MFQWLLQSAEKSSKLVLIMNFLILSLVLKKNKKEKSYFVSLVKIASIFHGRQFLLAAYLRLELKQPCQSIYML